MMNVDEQPVVVKKVGFDDRYVWNFERPQKEEIGTQVKM